MKEDPDDDNAEYEYLVKWKNLAYVHCEWVDEEVALAQPQGKSRAQRFHKKEDQRPVQRENGGAENSDEDPIPKDFLYCRAHCRSAQQPDKEEQAVPLEVAIASIQRIDLRVRGGRQR